MQPHTHVKLAILPSRTASGRVGATNNGANGHSPDTPVDQIMHDENEDAAMTLEHIAFERQRAIGGVIYSRAQSEEAPETTKAMQPYGYAFGGGSTTSWDTAGLKLQTHTQLQTQAQSADMLLPQLNSNGLFKLLNGRTEMIWRLLVALLPSENQARFCVDAVSSYVFAYHWSLN
jgi:hypothetical protein